VIGSEERQEKILTVVVDDVEVSQYRKNGARTETGHSLEEHQATCDFTINSIAMDINEKIIDKHNGESDLKDKLIRFVGKPADRIEEDFLRLLRGIRFGAKYKFKLENDTAMSIELCAYKIKELPQERVRDELLKILAYPKGIDYLLFYGFIEIIVTTEKSEVDKIFEKLKGLLK